MAIYLWKNVQGYIPNENTFFYVKGDGDIIDTGPNHITFTSQNLSFATEGSLTYIVFGGNSANGFYTTSYNVPLPMTYNFWIYYNGGGTYSPRLLDNTDSNDNRCQICQDRTTPGISINGTTRITTTTNQRYNILITQDGSGNVTAYKNGELQWSGSVTTNRYTGIIVGYKKSNSSDIFSGRMSEIILENIVRDGTYALGYFSETKSLYGY